MYSFDWLDNSLQIPILLFTTWDQKEKPPVGYEEMVKANKELIDIVNKRGQKVQTIYYNRCNKPITDPRLRQVAMSFFTHPLLGEFSITGNFAGVGWLLQVLSLFFRRLSKRRSLEEAIGFLLITDTNPRDSAFREAKEISDRIMEKIKARELVAEVAIAK
jgi:hypothetical protein